MANLRPLIDAYQHQPLDADEWKITCVLPSTTCNRIYDTVNILQLAVDKTVTSWNELVQYLNAGDYTSATHSFLQTVNNFADVKIYWRVLFEYMQILLEFRDVLTEPGMDTISSVQKLIPIVDKLRPFIYGMDAGLMNATYALGTRR